MQNHNTLSFSKVDESPSDVPLSTVTLHLGGPSSRQVPVPITPLEAVLLARHWIREIIEYDHRRSEQGAECPPGQHVRNYASLRLEALEASGLLLRDDVNLLFEEVRQEMQLPSFDQGADDPAASGQPRDQWDMPDPPT
jgi:hypothetical protein